MKKSYILLMLLSISFFLVACSTETDSSEDVSEKDASSTNEEMAEKETATDTNEESNQDTETETQAGQVIEFEGITFEVPSFAVSNELEESEYPTKSFILDANSGVNFNVIVEELPESKSINDYIEAATSQTGFEYLSKEYYTTNGIEWNESVSLNHTENGTVKLNQRTFIDDSKAYIFTYGSVQEIYEDQLSTFKTITNSVQN
ncbi:DUF1795 domain-containing protein [Oceanobacillus halotolerans]|uniref:DUF1795 domain-containing protein n=1 Tax=Oceanobacillus halotolerans TaxID=2663380 RepID=UPI0013DCEB9D|nr:DUF1795 domain-containing protein [Oceanobacillus halotolerans]